MNFSHGAFAWSWSWVNRLLGQGLAKLSTIIKYTFFSSWLTEQNWFQFYTANFTQRRLQVATLQKYELSRMWPYPSGWAVPERVSHTRSGVPYPSGWALPERVCRTQAGEPYTSGWALPERVSRTWSENGKREISQCRKLPQVTEFGVFKVDHSQPAKLSVSPIFLAFASLMNWKWEKGDIPM